MVQYWIFVSLPYSDFNRGTIPEMIDKIRKSGKWPIGKRTVHRKKIACGDKVIFYQAGEGAREFVGTGELLSSLQVENESLSDFAVIGTINIWETPVPMVRLLDNLQFVKNRRNWGIHLKGGIVRISEDDYRLILRRRSKRSRKEGHAQ